MANIDSVFGRMFTEPRSRDNRVRSLSNSLGFVSKENLFSNHSFRRTNRSTSLMFVQVQAVSANTFCGRRSGVAKVRRTNETFFCIASSLRSGFGFTLKGKSDFNLHKFLVGPPETFDTFYGVGGVNGDGDVFSTENIDELQKYVYGCTRNHGVHMMMADGVKRRDGEFTSTSDRLHFRVSPSKVKKIFKKFSVNNCTYVNS